MQFSWKDLNQWVEEWKNSQFPKGIKHQEYVSDDWWGEKSREDFPSLVEFVLTKLGKLGGNERVELELALAMIILRPVGASLPPTQMYEDLKRSAQEWEAYDDDWEYRLDLVIAYGNGWGRQISVLGISYSPGSWEGRWDGAFFALRELVKRSLGATLDDLQEMLNSNWKNLPDIIIDLADEITIELANGKCRCKQRRESLGKTNSSQLGSNNPSNYLENCGNPDHNLAIWEPDPRKLRLRALVRQAVRGSATQEGNQKLVSGAFSTSMAYPLIAKEFNLRIGTVEFKICHYCHPEAISEAVEHRKELEIRDLQSKYEGAACPHCDTLEDPTKTYYKGRKNWIFSLENKEKGLLNYRQVERFHCGGCGNYYEIAVSLKRLYYDIYTKSQELEWNKEKYTRLNLTAPDEDKAELKAENKKLEKEVKELKEVRDQQEELVGRCPLCNTPPPVKNKISNIWKQMPVSLGKVLPDQEYSANETQSNYEGWDPGNPFAEE